MTDEQMAQLDARLKQIIAMIGILISASSAEGKSPAWLDEAVKAVEIIIHEVEDWR